MAYLEINICCTNNTLGKFIRIMTNKKENQQSNLSNMKMVDNTNLKLLIFNPFLSFQE